MNMRFWQGKKVFLTGHTGFKGAWLSLWLLQMRADVYGYSLAPTTSPNLYEAAGLDKKVQSTIADINDLKTLKEKLNSVQPDIVIHLAAQPLVQRSYREPLETFQTNIMGTAHLLEAARGVSSIGSIVIITTDKCYDNKEWSWGYREIDPLGGYDPYSSSKACAEIVTEAMKKSFFSKLKTPVAINTMRAGNVIGGGDWSDDRLIPDVIKAIQSGKPVDIRYPHSTRPWQHVLEPLYGYLQMAEKSYECREQYSGAWNIGPEERDVQTVDYILSRISEFWRDSFQWEQDTNVHNHEARFLKLDSSKFRAAFQWQPKWNVDQAIEKTCIWYQEFYNKKNAADLCLRQIQEFILEC